MVAARDMEGVDGHRVIALPHAALRAVLEKYGRLVSLTGLLTRRVRTGGTRLGRTCAALAQYARAQ